MNSAPITLKYTGTAVDFGEIDVKDLVPALIGLGDLIHTSANIIFKGEMNARVKVKADEKGSYLLHLIIEGYSSFVFFTSKNEEAIKKLLTDLGLINVGISIGFFYVIKHLKGKKPTHITPIDKKTSKIENDTKKTIIIKNTTLELYKNYEVRKAIQTLTELLGKKNRFS